jgi:hypothetical protein
LTLGLTKKELLEVGLIIAKHAEQSKSGEKTSDVIMKTANEFKEKYNIQLDTNIINRVVSLATYEASLERNREKKRQEREESELKEIELKEKAVVEARTRKQKRKSEEELIKPTKKVRKERVLYEKQLPIEWLNAMNALSVLKERGTEMRKSKRLHEDTYVPASAVLHPTEIHTSISNEFIREPLSAISTNSETSASSVLSPYSSSSSSSPSSSTSINSALLLQRSGMQANGIRVKKFASSLFSKQIKETEVKMSEWINNNNITLQEQRSAIVAYKETLQKINCAAEVISKKFGKENISSS